MKKTCVLVPVLGSGGVGKTTTSASLALALAEEGLKVVVITVDPAHRLAQALGLESLHHEPRRVKDFSNGGYIDALWLDQNNALEELVKRHSRDIPDIDRIVKNRLFRIIQSQLGGIEEYLGVERILSLRDTGFYDVCVLDTPPSRHALDFLEAPRHLLKFFDEGVLKVFLAQSGDTQKGFFSKILNAGKTQVIEVFKNFLGKGFLGELADLLGYLKPLHKVFTQTALDIEAWTKSPDYHLVLVSLLESNPLDEARLLSIELDAKGLKEPSVVILNKSLPATTPSATDLDLLSQEGKTFLLRAFEQQEKLRNKIQTAHFFGRIPIAHIPRQSVTQMSQEELLNIGRRVRKQWPHKII